MKSAIKAIRNIAIGSLISSIFFCPSFANDSEAQTAVGGLVLKKNSLISLDSEDLFISQNLVRVKYVFTNLSNKDQNILVNFPLPTNPPSDDFWADDNFPSFSSLEFKTYVDGKEIKLNQEIRAKARGKDITETLKKYNFPIDWVENYGAFDSALAKLSPDELNFLKKQNIIAPLYENDDGFRANWVAEYQITRNQIFPANKSTEVMHVYRPLSGGSVGGSLSKSARNDKNYNFADYYGKKYCPDKQFLAAIDKKEAQGMHYSESWIGYILKSGANWAGPIKDFRLVVDKGHKNNLISFCETGVKKITDTQFEVRKKNYEPNRDIDILIVNFYLPE